MNQPKTLILATALALVGCQAQGPAALSVRSAGLQARTAPAQAGPALVASGSGLGSDLAPSVGGTAALAVGVEQRATLRLGGGPILNPSTQAAEELVAPQPTQALQGTPILAAQGGRVTSPDGKLFVDVPPGVLNQDTAIELKWVDTSSWSANETKTPGLAFELNLNGALLLPGTQLVVKGQADPRFVADLKAHLPHADLAQFGLSQGPEGLMLAMPIKGPLLAPPDASVASLAPGTRTVESGLLPLPAPDPSRGQGFVGGQAYRLMEALRDPVTNQLVSLDGSLPEGQDPNNPFYKTQVPVSKPTDCSNWKEILKFEVPANWEAMKAHENGQIGNGKTMFDCTLMHSFDWFNKVNTDLHNGNKTCVAVPKPGVTAKPGELKLTTVPVKVIWDEGEGERAGKPAEGAIVRFDGPWTQAMQLNGAHPDVKVPASGQVNYPFLVGVPVKVSAFTMDDPTPTLPVQVTTQATNALITIKLKSRHPKFNLTVDSVTKLPAGKVDLTFTIDGEKGTRQFTWKANDTKATFPFVVFVGDGPKHKFQLTGVSVTPDGQASSAAALMGAKGELMEVLTGKTYELKALVVAPNAII